MASLLSPFTLNAPNNLDSSRATALLGPHSLNPTRVTATFATKAALKHRVRSRGIPGPAVGSDEVLAARICASHVSVHASGGAGVEVEDPLAGDAEAAQDLRDVQDIIDTMELLKKKRQMTVQETRLVLMIEDPREAERRKQLGVESESGCSRDEVATAFMEVMEDRVPSDRLVLRTLADEMRNWPRLREQEDDGPNGNGAERQSLYARITNVGLPGGRRAKPPPSAAAADWDTAAEAAIAEATKAKDEEKNLGETLPPWVGYGVLYGVSSVPIIIGVVVVIILFLNSLQ